MVASEATEVDASYTLKAELPGWQSEYGVRQNRSKGDTTIFFTCTAGRIKLTPTVMEMYGWNRIRGKDQEFILDTLNLVGLPDKYSRQLGVLSLKCMGWGLCLGPEVYILHVDDI